MHFNSRACLFNYHSKRYGPRALDLSLILISGLNTSLACDRPISGPGSGLFPIQLQVSRLACTQTRALLSVLSWRRRSRRSPRPLATLNVVSGSRSSTVDAASV